MNVEKRAAYRQAAIDVFGDLLAPENSSRILACVEMASDAATTSTMNALLGRVLMEFRLVSDELARRCEPFLTDTTDPMMHEILSSMKSGRQNTEFSNGALVMRALDKQVQKIRANPELVAG